MAPEKLCSFRSESYAKVIAAGDDVRIIIRAKIQRGSIKNPTCGILIKDRLGYDIFGTNSHCLKANMGEFHSGQEVCFTFAVTMSVGSGDYTLTVALHSDKTHVAQSYHWIDRALLIQVLPSLDFEFVGAAKLAVTFSHEIVNAGA